MQTWVDDLVEEYEEGRKELRKLKSKLGDSELDRLDKTQINSMIQDMSFSIDWMKRGRRPGNRRGIDRRNVYQRNALINSELFPDLEGLQQEEKELSEDVKRKVIDVLAELSARERECFLLHMVKCMSFSEISDTLGISRSSVQVYVKRAKEKIKKIV